MGGHAINPGFLIDVAREHFELAKVYEFVTDSAGAAQLRAVGNLLCAIADGNHEIASDVGTVLPKVAARPPEPEKFEDGDLVVLKAIGTVKTRIDGPHLAYVVELERREFSDINAPSWATTRTAFAMADEVSAHGDVPALAEADRKALQAWIDYILDEYSPQAAASTNNTAQLEQGRRLLERLLGR